MNYCLCGCGQEVKNKWIRFHHLKYYNTKFIGRKHTKEAIEKMSKAKLGCYVSTEAKLMLSQKAKERWQNPEFRKKMSEIRKQWIGEKNPFYGKHHTEQSLKEAKLKRAWYYEHNKGENNYFFKPDRQRQYPLEWRNTLKKAIRERDNYKCQICGAPQEECNRNLDVHHIDGNKNNCNPDNLISLCVSCHMTLEKSPNRKPRINRVNSGKPRNGNPEPSQEIANRLLKGAETRTEETIMSNSALNDENHYDIVRHSEESEKNREVTATMRHPKGGRQ